MIYTIGYQAITPTRLFEIVRGLDAVLIDVRSNPNRAKAGFSRSALSGALGDSYRWGGEYLGGRLPEAHMAGIVALRKYEGVRNCVLMCMEDAPADCHRHHMICAIHFPEALHIFDDQLIFAHELERALHSPDPDDEPETVGSLDC